LGAMASAVEDTALRAAKEGLGHEAFLLELARTERAAKSARRIERLRHHSGLLPGKDFRALDLNRFAPATRMQIERLRGGSFLTESINVVAVGRPGAGKSHLACALGHELVEQGHPVLFASTSTLVQRLLAARGLRDAKRALVGSGLFVIAQFALFLLVGTSLWLAGADRPGLASDAIYPTFVLEHLPPGLAGLVVAAILAAASVAAALNSLASASTYDFYVPLTGRRDPEHLLKVGRAMTLLWAAVLVVGAMLVKDRDTPVVVLALSIASITYGGLLGSYLLGGLWPRARQRDVIIAILVGVAVMIPVVLGFPRRLLPGLAWPWYVPIGTSVTVMVGVLSSLVGRADGQTAGRAPATT